MTTVSLDQFKSDLAAKLAIEDTKLSALTTADQAMLTTLNGVQAQNASLAQQLKDALASQGIDEAGFAPIFATIDAHSAQIQTQVDTVVAGVTAASAPAA